MMKDFAKWFQVLLCIMVEVLVVDGSMSLLNASDTLLNYFGVILIFATSWVTVAAIRNAIETGNIFKSKK